MLFNSGDCKEIQPVYPKGDQSWVFIGRTDVAPETPVLWPLDVKSWLIWKDPPGEGNGSALQCFCLENPMSRRAWRTAVHGVAINRTWLSDWTDWCWSWSSNTLATWSEKLTHWKRPWCWERLKAGREVDDWGWGSWIASLTQWTWGWASSKSWWWTGKPSMLQSTGSQRVGHNWVTELNWTDKWLMYENY